MPKATKPTCTCGACTVLAAQLNGCMAGNWLAQAAYYRRMGQWWQPVGCGVALGNHAPSTYAKTVQ